MGCARLANLKSHLRNVHGLPKVNEGKEKGKEKETEDVEMKDLNRRSKTQKTKPRLECDICGESFGGKDGHKSHKSKHIKGNWPYKCSTCGEKFKIFSLFKEHLSKRVVNSLQTICPPINNGKGGEKKEEEVEENPKPKGTEGPPWECEVCGKVLSAKGIRRMSPVPRCNAIPCRSQYCLALSNCSGETSIPHPSNPC